VTARSPCIAVIKISASLSAVAAPTEIVVQAEHSHKAAEVNHTKDERVVMNQRDDQRAQEINNLELALANFALRLDAFEARTNSQPTKTNAEPKLGSPETTKE
jgi:hypothetical protein